MKISQQKADLSIHAPTRGATINNGVNSIYTFTFNPRSYKRSDFASSYPFCLLSDFQSTLLQEERLVAYVKNISNYLLSIHAPTRGATINALNSGIYSNTFNPRSYKRSDGFCFNKQRLI